MIIPEGVLEKGAEHMRVLYFINGFDPGGAEHGLLTLVESGFFDGHELDIVGMCRGRGDLAEKLRRTVGEERFHVAHEKETLSPADMLRGAFLLFRELRRFRPDIVVLSLKQANLVGRLVLRFFPAVHCVSFEHISRYRARRAEWLYGALLRWTSGRVDEVWSDCRETLEETRSYFVPRARYENVVPLFCLDEDMPEKTSYELGGTLKLAGAGRLVDRKNFDRLIEATRQLNDEGIATELTILGDGPEYGVLQALRTKLGLQDKVSLPGYRAKWFREALKADIFLNTSDTEGFCIVVAEALAVGLPVIATDVGGIREYGHDGVNMLKLQGESVGEVIAAIKRLRDDEGLRRDLGRRGRSDMQAEYALAMLRERGKAVLSRKEAAGVF